MKKVNLRDLYPDVYKTDAFLEVTDEVQAVFQSDERAEAAYERKMYRYKAQYSLDCENGIENCGPAKAGDAGDASGGKAAARADLLRRDGFAGETGKKNLCSVLSGDERK